MYDISDEVSVFFFFFPFFAGILFVLVYRTDDYKRLKATVEKQSKKCIKCGCNVFGREW